MPQPSEIKLTKAEQLAKDHFMRYYCESINVPCDINLNETDILPTWFDEAKFKRGQGYYHKNRLGIMDSNFVGLICLLADQRGAKILESTGKTDTKNGVIRRYTSTIIHTSSWFDIDLKVGSKSRKSLAAVRRMHFKASEANRTTIGLISQAEMIYTAFGFMGFTLVRPHVFGIETDNREDLEAFIHVWAVFCHLLGVKEEFNHCLLPLDALEIFCLMFVRYIFLPIIQIEAPVFLRMTKALIDGLNEIIPQMDYQGQLYVAKSTLSLPGYQYYGDIEKDKLCRSILNQNDVDAINEAATKSIGSNHVPLTVDIPLIEVRKNADEDDVKMSSMEEYCHKVIELSSKDKVTIQYVSYEKEWESSLSDSRYFDLSFKNQFCIKLRHYFRIVYEYSGPRYLFECIVSKVLQRLAKG